ncbi:MAG TPA: hypothetical protein VFA07_19365 [Chthonomonadaceae bacterium]|nr:hypothetical protein [Chthonomonadaceae bacterium]
MAEESQYAQLREQVEAETQEEGVEGQEVPFEDGFSGKSILGALFVAFIMLPGALYLGLVAGQGLGPAAEWVTIVLFAEVMRRSFLPMKRQEIYILYYVAASLTSLWAEKGISGGPFGGLIWNQYFIQTPVASLVAKDIPHWVVPPVGSVALLHRTFFSMDWLWPIVLLVVSQVLGRVNSLSAGYFLFRITSDIERLPFPMAPVAASGATALAEAASKEESWRWRIFSIGTIIGLVFGFFYIAIPVFTGVVFGKAFQLIPIPFFDLTTNTESFLPGALTGISGDLGKVLTGFVIPYPIVAGSAAGSVLCRIVAAPFLYHLGVFGTAGNNGWSRGMDAIYTKQATDIKFWLSIGIGLQVAVALIGFLSVFQAFANMRRQNRDRRLFAQVPRGRGDLPLWIPIAAWVAVTVFYLCLTEYLLHLDSRPGENHMAAFPAWLLVFYGLIWSPINSYVSARMFGITGSGVTFPYLKQVSIMKSGYQYVDIWYAPIPLDDFGWLAQKFREIELTRTKFISVVKVEVLMLFVMLPASFIFWAFFWHTSQIPSSQFPYANQFWPIQATMEALFDTINRKQGGITWVRDAINFPRIFGGLGAGLGVYAVFSIFRLPVLFYYGFIGGAGDYPHNTIPTFIGAWLGRKYFQKRFGVDNWRMYTPVLLAGFSCGTGLIAMASIALALIAKSVNYLPF